MHISFRSIVLVFSVALSFCAHANVGDAPGNIDKIARSIFPDSSLTVEESALGDLNDDGRADLAILIRFKDPQIDRGEVLRISVFLSNSKGGYTHYVNSQDVFPHERASISVTIEKKVLVLHREGSGGCCSRWFEDFKFKIIGGELVLIGQETASFAVGDKIDDAGTSSNFLNKRVIFWRKIGKKRNEVKVTLPTFDLLKLSNFDYSTYERFLPKQARGHIDENFFLKQ